MRAGRRPPLQRRAAPRVRPARRLRPPLRVRVATRPRCLVRPRVRVDLLAPAKLRTRPPAAPVRWIRETATHVYIKGQRAYFANYTDGLRILDVSNAASAELKKAGFFDTVPNSGAATFDGAWTAFPFFASGTVIVGDMRSGLFIVRPQAAILGAAK